MKKDIIAKSIAVEVLFDTVSIRLVCGDDYKAQVLYDDIVERLLADGGLTLIAERKSDDITHAIPEE